MFTPRNDLERSLAKAAQDAAHRPQFYRDFAQATVFFIQHGPPPETDGPVTLGRGATLKIVPVVVEGRPHLPLFSSLERMRAVVKDDVGCIGINALEFLKVTRGAELVLNPGSGCGKVFTKEEVAAILDGSLGRPGPSYTVEPATRVVMGPPARYPQALADALARLFEGMPEVRAAYVARFCNPDRDEKPRTLVGIEASGDWEGVVARAGLAARGVEIPDPPVDIVRITGRGGGIEDYFLNACEPFFRKPPDGAGRLADDR